MQHARPTLGERAEERKAAILLRMHNMTMSNAFQRWRYKMACSTQHAI
jgi:hypothetical protein